jgi:hypothetical protein
MVGGAIDVIATTGPAREREARFSKGLRGRKMGVGELCNCSHALRKSLRRG